MDFIISAVRLYSGQILTDSVDIFCKDSGGLTNCFGCIGLRNKSHCIYNKARRRIWKFMRDAGWILSGI